MHSNKDFDKIFSQSLLWTTIAVHDSTRINSHDNDKLLLMYYISFVWSVWSWGMFTLWIGSKLIRIVCVHTECALYAIRIECAFGQSTSIGGLKLVWRWIASLLLLSSLQLTHELQMSLYNKSCHHVFCRCTKVLTRGMIISIQMCHATRVLWYEASGHLTCIWAARSLSPTSNSSYILPHFFTRIPLGYIGKNIFE